MHIILGGWPERTPREQIVKDSLAWLDQQPQAFKALVLDPFAPTKYGSIAKLRTAKGHAEKLAFEASRALRDATRTAPPTWAALERSPEAGKRKRLTRDMVEKCRMQFPQLDIDDNGVVYSGGVEAARFLAGATTWEQRRGWNGTGVSWQLFDEAMKK